MENFLKNITKKAKSAAQNVSDWFAPSAEGTRVRDVVREIPKETGKVAKSIAQSIPRSILSTFLTVAPKKVKENIGEIKPKEDFGKIGDIFLGDESIKTIPMMGKETLTGFGVGEDSAKKFGPLVGFGLTAADLWPGTSGKGKAVTTAMKEAGTGKNFIGAIIKQLRPAEKTFIQEQGVDLATMVASKAKAKPSEILGSLSAKAKEEVISKMDRPTAQKSTSIPVIVKGKDGFEVMDGGHALAGALKKDEPIEFFAAKTKPGEAKVKGVRGGVEEGDKIAAKATTEGEVRTLLGIGENTQKTTKVAAKEAVEGQGGDSVMYHYTTPENAAKIREEGFKIPKTKIKDVISPKMEGQGAYFINGNEPQGVGKSFGSERIAVKLKPEAKIIDLNKEVPDFLKGVSERKWNEVVTKNGYDGVTRGGQTAIYNTDKIDVIRETKQTGVKGAKSVGEIIEEGGGKVPPTKTAKVAAGAADNEAERRLITRVKQANPTMEGLLSGKYQRRSTKELVDEADKIIKENPTRAEEMAKMGTDDQSVAVAMRMIDNLTTEAKAATGVAKDALYEKAANIANEAARNLTESGRSVQAASIYSRMTPEGMVRYAARQIQKYNEEIAGKRTMQNFFGTAKKIPELNGQQIKDITEEMEKISKMADGTEKNRAVFNLQEKVRKLIPSSIYDKIVSFWKAGLLTGLKTTGINVASNLSHAVSEIAKDIPASFVDKIVSLFTGKRTLVLTTDKALKGAAEGVAKGWDFLKTGFDERNVLSKLDYRKVNFGDGKIAKAAQKYTDTVFGLLGAEDQPFYYAAKARSLANQAAAAAKNEGLKGKEAVKFAQNLIENPTDDMLKYATLDAETAVFQQESWLAKRGRQAQKVFGQVILPFAKTPANVANAMINYSPAGIVKTIIQNIGKGKFDQRLFSQGIGRGVTGTAALAIGAALYEKGMLALSYPTGEKERKQWELEGKTMNSIKIGDKWRNVGVLGPLGMVAVVGGHLRKGIDETGSFTGGLVNAAGGAGSSLTDQTFLSGVNRVVDALNDPSRSFEGFASSLAGSIVPTLVADFARATDQYERKTTGPMDRLQSRVPGLRQGLEPRIDTFGEKIPTQNFLAVMADATRPGTRLLDENDPVMKEIKRLAENEFQVTPTQLGPNKGYESLSDAENRYLLQVAGKYARKAIEDTITNRSYNRLDDEQKAKEITNAVDEAKVEARARAIYEFTKNLSAGEARRKLAKMKEDKLLTNQVFDAYLSYKRRQ